MAIMSDGAAVMKLLKEILKIEQQLCLAHGNHLGVLDVVCKKKPVKKPEEKSSTAFEDEDEESNEDESGDEESSDEESDEEESGEDESGDDETNDGEWDDDEEGPEVEIVEEEREELDLNDAIKYLIERVRAQIIRITASPVLSFELEQAIKKWQKRNKMKIQELVSLINNVLAPTNKLLTNTNSKIL